MIHVDSDVFLFNDLFLPFIEGKYDGIVQDKLIPRVNHMFSNSFMVNNRVYLTKSGIFDCALYDGSCYSCGVLGMNNDMKVKYFEMVDLLSSKEKEFDLKNISFPSILEELGFYLTRLKYGFKVHEILPHNEILAHRGNPQYVGDKHGYTHMWFKTKYVKKNIELIKNKIKKDFNEYYSLVEEYDKFISNYKIEYVK